MKFTTTDRGGSAAHTNLCRRARVLHDVLIFAVLIYCSVPALLGGQRLSAALPDEHSIVETPVSRPPVFSFSRDGLLIADHQRMSSVNVHGYTQTDARLFITNLTNHEHEVFLFRRVRPLVEGWLARRIEFRFMPDFGEGKSVIQEAYSEWAPGPYAALRVGKFKSPIGLEVLRSDRELTFPERSLASDFVPIRDLGAQIGGKFLNGAMEYAAGAFTGSEDGANAEFAWEGTNEVAARIFLLPFVSSDSESLQQLGFGMAGSLGDNHSILPTFKTMGQQTFFRYGQEVSTVGAHERFAPQAYYFRGSLGFMGEYVRSDEAAQVSGNKRELSNRGWQIAGSYVLTGEKNTYSGVRPDNNFDPAHPLRSRGAWEVAFRHSEAHMDRAAFPLYADPVRSAQVARETVGGVTWYLNRYIKFMTHFAHTSFDMAAGNKPLVTERMAISRLQFAF